MAFQKIEEANREGMLVASLVTEENKSFQGKSVLENAHQTGKTPYTFMRELLVAEKGRVGTISFTMSEENLIMGP